MQGTFSQVTGDKGEGRNYQKCYYLYSYCTSGIYPGGNTFNPGPITLAYHVSYQTPYGYNSYTFLGVAEPVEIGWEVCFDIDFPSDIGIIVDEYICTVSSTTDYVVEEVIADEIYLDMHMPKEATIGGHFYKAWHTPISYLRCEAIWPIGYNDEYGFIPTWISCQNDINVIFTDGLELDPADNSGICLQIAIHEYPLVYNHQAITYQHYSDYTAREKINITNLLSMLDRGKRYVMSLSTVCCSPGYVPIESVVGTPNKLRTLIFDYEGEKQFEADFIYKPNGDFIHWDNSFPGIEVQGNPFLLTSIYKGGINPSAYYRYEIIKLTNTGEDNSILYDSGLILGSNFFNPTSNQQHVYVYIDYVTNGYFSTSANEYFVIRVTSTDPCTSKREVYFHTNDNPLGGIIPPDPEKQYLRSRGLNPFSASLLGCPSKLFRLKISEAEDNRSSLFLYIFNSSGQRVFSKKIKSSPFVIRESGQWTSGIYYFVLKSSDRIYRGKWIKH